MRDSSGGRISTYELTLNKIRSISNHKEPYAPPRREARLDLSLHESPGYRTVTNLLFAYVPKLLSHFIKLETYCKSGFEHQRCDFHERLGSILLRSEVYAHPLMRDSITGQLAELCGAAEAELDMELTVLSQDVTSMISRLNSPGCSLNCAFEHALNICVRQDITPHYGEPELKKSDLAHLLLFYGCSRHFIRRICNVHYRSSIMKSASTAHKSRRNKHDFLLCMGNGYKAARIMLMLNHYLVALRVHGGRHPSPDYLSLREFMSPARDAQVSLPLAVGVYFAVMVISRGSYCSALRAAPDQDFPSFEDFYEILGYALHGRCTAVGCVNCNACYLEFSDELVCSRDLRRSRCRGCPYCSCSSCYELEDRP